MLWLRHASEESRHAASLLFCNMTANARLWFGFRDGAAACTRGLDGTHAGGDARRSWPGGVEDDRREGG